MQLDHMDCYHGTPSECGGSSGDSQKDTKEPGVPNMVSFCREGLTESIDNKDRNS